MSKIKTKVVHLKLAKNHPRNAFRVLDLVVTGRSYLPYEINEAHAKELEMEGVKHWVKVKERDEKEDKEAELKAAQEKADKEAEEARLAQELADKEAAEAEAAKKELEEKQNK